VAQLPTDIVEMLWGTSSVSVIDPPSQMMTFDAVCVPPGCAVRMWSIWSWSASSGSAFAGAVPPRKRTVTIAASARERMRVLSMWVVGCSYFHAM
jgi:hypothetical protein